MSPLPQFSPETLQWLRDNLYGTRRVVFTDDLNATVDKFLKNVDTRIENYVAARFRTFGSQIRGEVLQVINSNAAFQEILDMHKVQIRSLLLNHEIELGDKASACIVETEARLKITRSQLVQSVLDVSSSGPLVKGIEQRVIREVSPGLGFYAGVFALGAAGAASVMAISRVLES